MWVASGCPTMRSVHGVASSSNSAGPAHFVGGVLNAVAPRIAQDVIEIRSAHRNFGARQLRPHFGRNPAQWRIERQAGFPRRRSLCRQKRHSGPSPAHFAQLADLALQVGDHLPIRQPAIVQPFRERGQLARGLVPRASLRPGRRSRPPVPPFLVRAARPRSSVPRRSRSKRRSPHKLRLSKAEADATCEHQRNRADEAVLVLGTNRRAGEHLLRNSSLDTMDRFQTRVGLGGRKGE